MHAPPQSLAAPREKLAHGNIEIVGEIVGPSSRVLMSRGTDCTVRHIRGVNDRERCMTVSNNRGYTPPNDSRHSRNELSVATAIDDVRANRCRPDPSLRMRGEHQLL